MLGRRILLIISSMHVAYAISILIQPTAVRFAKEIAKRRRHQRLGGEDKISALPDDLLVHISLRVPTKDVVTTMILSKRWRSVWTMVPMLGYLNIIDDTHKVSTGGLFVRLLGCLFNRSDIDHQQPCLWRFVDKSLQLHKAPVLEILALELSGPFRCHVDVGKWIANAVDRRVRELALVTAWTVSEPAKLSKSLYTCDTLVNLCLAGNTLVDVPSRVFLPSLVSIVLYYVVYKDEDSLFPLLSNCPNLKSLLVRRQYHDNVRNFNIKVPSLERLLYVNEYSGVHNEGLWGSLVIDSPDLKKFVYSDVSGDSCSIENKPCFDKASIGLNSYHPDDKFMRSISSVTNLKLVLDVASAAWCNSINFSKLMECIVTLTAKLDWLESLMGLLQNSPNLKALFIDQTLIQLEEDFSLSWNEPSIPGCFSAHLEIFEWKEYIGRSKEKEAIKYIFANSKCLKRARFSMKSTCKVKDREKMMKELQSMSRVSTSSQLLFSTQLEFPSFVNEIQYTE